MTGSGAPSRHSTAQWNALRNHPQGITFQPLNTRQHCTCQPIDRHTCHSIALEPCPFHVHSHDSPEHCHLCRVSWLTRAWSSLSRTGSLSAARRARVASLCTGSEGTPRGSEQGCLVRFPLPSSKKPQSTTCAHVNDVRRPLGPLHAGISKMQNKKFWEKSMPHNNLFSWGRQQAGKRIQLQWQTTYKWRIPLSGPEGMYWTEPKQKAHSNDPPPQSKSSACSRCDQTALC